MQADHVWDKESKFFYFRAFEKKQPRTFYYQSAKNKTHADVVTVAMHPKEPDKVSFVRHHVFGRNIAGSGRNRDRAA